VVRLVADEVVEVDGEAVVLELVGELAAVDQGLLVCRLGFSSRCARWCRRGPL
jgi:hypothetical protein